MSDPNTSGPDFDTLVTNALLKQYIDGMQMPLPYIAELTATMHAKHNHMLQDREERAHLVELAAPFAKLDLQSPDMATAQAQMTAELFIERLGIVHPEPVVLSDILRLCKISEHGFFKEIIKNVHDPEEIRRLASQAIKDLISFPLMFIAEDIVKNKMNGEIDDVQKMRLTQVINRRIMDYIPTLYPKHEEEMTEEEFRTWGLQVLIFDPSMWEHFHQSFSGETTEKAYDPRNWKYETSPAGLLHEMVPQIDLNTVPTNEPVSQDRIVELVQLITVRGFQENRKAANTMVLGALAHIVNEKPDAPLQELIAFVANSVEEDCQHYGNVLDQIDSLETDGSPDAIAESEKIMSAHPAAYMDTSIVYRMLPPLSVEPMLRHMSAFSSASYEGTKKGLHTMPPGHEKLSMLLAAGGFKKIEMNCRALRQRPVQEN